MIASRPQTILDTCLAFARHSPARLASTTRKPNEELLLTSVSIISHAPRSRRWQHEPLNRLAGRGAVAAPAMPGLVLAAALGIWRDLPCPPQISLT
jgi:hypothetical protein